MIYAQNKENTVRIKKCFYDRGGYFNYFLEKLVKKEKRSWFFGIKIEEKWDNGGRGIYMPPIHTNDMTTVKQWMKYYHMLKLE